MKNRREREFVYQKYKADKEFKFEVFGHPVDARKLHAVQYALYAAFINAMPMFFVAWIGPVAIALGMILTFSWFALVTGSYGLKEIFPGGDRTTMYFAVLNVVPHYAFSVYVPAWLGASYIAGQLGYMQIAV